MASRESAGVASAITSISLRPVLACVFVSVCRLTASAFCTVFAVVRCRSVSAPIMPVALVVVLAVAVPVLCAPLFVAVLLAAAVFAVVRCRSASAPIMPVALVVVLAVVVPVFCAPLFAAVFLLLVVLDVLPVVLPDVPAACSRFLSCSALTLLISAMVSPLYLKKAEVCPSALVVRAQLAPASAAASCISLSCLSSSICCWLRLLLLSICCKLLTRLLYLSCVLVVRSYSRPCSWYR